MDYEITFVGGHKLKITAEDYDKFDPNECVNYLGKKNEKIVFTDHVIYIQEATQDKWQCPSGKWHPLSEDCTCGTLIFPAPKK